ncbi:hypothetical protein PIB30_108122 [Stylosanthes scabra]|uniref:Uncharacterized protein n=1 Tax=Stylosanthes scabra TaxID=79078 RepID=A0ABU6VZE0_9FABA|nr:hypothetical protein [Stylosanthes scabra]
MTMEESIHVVFDETNSCIARKDISDEFVEMMDSLNLDGEEKLEESKEVNPNMNDDQVPIIETTQEQQSELPKDWRTVKDHPLDNVIGEITKGIVLGKPRFPLLCNLCAITAILSAMMSSALTFSPLMMECMSMALAIVISDLFPLGTSECMMNTCQPLAKG